MKTLLAILSIGSFVMFGVGCSRSGSESAKTFRSNGVEVQIRGEEGKDVRMKDEQTGDVTVFGEDVEVPNDFPDDVPRYPGARTTMVLTERAERMATLYQVTTDDAEKVATWVDAALKVKGYSLGETYGNAETKYFAYVRRGIEMSVTIARVQKDKTTTITFVRTEEK